VISARGPASTTPGSSPSATTSPTWAGSSRPPFRRCVVPSWPRRCARSHSRRPTSTTHPRSQPAQPACLSS